MKSILLLLFIIFITSGIYSQTDQIPKHYELKGQAYTQADSILDVWMDTQYPVILKKNKLKMTCAKCTNIFMDVTLDIDSSGQLKSANIVKTVKCGGEFSQNLILEFLAFFKKCIFPPSLREIMFTYRLGTGLKC